MADVLITGGAGFIGGYLSRFLIRCGLRVRILDCLSQQVHGVLPRGLEWLDDKNIQFIRGTINDRQTVQAAITDVKYVVHLAAETGTGQSMYEISRYNSVNTQGTALLLDCLVNGNYKSVKRFVLASSRSVYGEGAYFCDTCADNLGRISPHSRSEMDLLNGNWEPRCSVCSNQLRPIPTREDDPVMPASIYAATKLAQEDLVRIACNSIGIEYAILRFQNVYGEGQSLKNPYTGILSIFSNRIRRRLEIPIFEDGCESRDFVHVEDVVQSITACINLKHGPNQVVNVGSGAQTTVIEVASQLMNALNIKVPLKITSEFRIGDIRHNCADISKLKSVLGVVPKIALKDGLARFVTWVASQPEFDDGLEKANSELKRKNLMKSK